MCRTEIKSGTFLHVRTFLNEATVLAMTDQQLLQDYLSTGSNDAFSALVDRYAGLVYAIALRQVRDPGLAQDVAQAVFLILARKASAISVRHASLGGWLFRTTRYAAANAVKVRTRRSRHEQEVARMEAHNPAFTDQDTEGLARNLDDAIAALNGRDREVVLLRFMRNLSFADIGIAMSVSENAAKKRLRRALDRLHRTLLRTTPQNDSNASSMLLGLLGNHLQGSAPGNVLAVLKSVGLAGNLSASVRAASIAKGVIRKMAVTKFITATTAVVATLLLVGLGVLFLIRVGGGHPSPAPIATRSAPVPTLPFTATTTPALTPVTITITDSDTGEVVAGATIARLVGRALVQKDHLLATTQTVIGKSNARGEFRLECDPAERSAFLVTAPGKTPQTFGFWGSVPEHQRLALTNASGSLSGRIVDEAGKPITGSTVHVRMGSFEFLEPVRLFSVPTISFDLDAKTDDNGAFAIPSSPPINVEEVSAEFGGRTHTIVSASENGEGYFGLDRRLRNGTFTGHAAQTALVETNIIPTPTTAPTLTLQLHVLDADTKLPIPNVRISPGGMMVEGQPFRTLSQSAMDLPGNDVRWLFDDNAWAYFLHVEADGYASATTRIVKPSEEKHANLELMLSKAAPIAIAVQTRNGQPASGARAYLATPTTMLNVPVGELRWDDPKPIATAGADGILHFTPPSGDYRLAILGPAGFAEAFSTDDPENSVILAPWASASITVAPAGKPLAGALVNMQTLNSARTSCPISWIGNSFTDAAGHVTIPKCRAGSCRLSVQSASSEPEVGWRYFEADFVFQAGEHAEVPLMSGKTTVTATIAAFPGYRWSTLWIQPSGPAIDLPPGLNQLPEKERDAEVSQAQTAAPDPHAKESVITDITLTLGDQSSIAVAGLRPGTYYLGGYATPIKPTEAGLPASQPAEPPALHWYFTVPTTEPKTIDLGFVSP